MKLALLSVTHSLHIECADGIVPSRKGDYLTMPAPEWLGGGTMGVPAFQVLEMALAGDAEGLAEYGITVTFLREHEPYDAASTEASYYLVPWMAPVANVVHDTSDPTASR